MFGTLKSDLLFFISWAIEQIFFFQVVVIIHVHWDPLPIRLSMIEKLGSSYLALLVEICTLIVLMNRY